MITIPEVTLYNILVGCLNFVKKDYQQAADKDKTMIADIFKGNKDHKKDYFTEAVALIMRDKTDNRCIEIRQAFDANRAKIPTVHLTIPSDESGENSIGVGQDEQFDGSFDRDDQRYSINARRFDTQYHVVMTSDNHSETMIMYHLFRALLISVFDTISHVGLENPILSGQELKINAELSPPHIYMRALGIRASYEVQVPQWFTSDIISDFLVGNQ